MLLGLDLTPEDVAGRVFYHGRGCDHCRGTGYSGRLAIFEIMTLDDELRDMVIAHRSANALRRVARKRGMRTLRESGLLAIYDGMTTLEEVENQTTADDDTDV